MDPLVSILIPAHNAERFIGKTLRSALAQTWPRKEIVIVDDGSRDKTLEIARSFESSEVRVVSQANQGAAAARNKAFSLCQGDFIQWLDADDLMHREKIRHQLSGEARNDKMALHSCKYAWFYLRPTGARVRSNPLFHDLSPRDWLVIALRTGAWLAPHAWLINRALAEKAGPWDPKQSLNDDGEYVCRLVAHSSKVKFHEKALCFYRGGNLGSLSQARSQKAFDSLLVTVNLSIGHLLRLDQGAESREAAVAFLNYVIKAFQINDRSFWQQFQAKAVELGGTLEPLSERYLARLARHALGETALNIGRQRLFHARTIRNREIERVRSLLNLGNASKAL